VCRVGNAEHREWLGKSVLEISSVRGRSPAETALLMFLEDGGRYWVAPRDKCDSDLDLLVSHRLGAIVGDGFSLAPDGPLAYQDRPNSYGTFPRFLGRYVRERGVLALEQAVAKITSLPAQRLGLWDRGILRPNAKADITVFDPETVIECADYARPQEYPVGIDWVVVNGRISVGPQGHTGARAGRVIQ
jgi:N-acyl-D-amino-acid deacylase